MRKRNEKNGKTFCPIVRVKSIYTNLPLSVLQNAFSLYVVRKIKNDVSVLRCNRFCICVCVCVVICVSFSFFILFRATTKTAACNSRNGRKRTGRDTHIAHTTIQIHPVQWISYTIPSAITIRLLVHWHVPSSALGDRKSCLFRYHTCLSFRLSHSVCMRAFVRVYSVKNAFICLSQMKWIQWKYVSDENCAHMNSLASSLDHHSRTNFHIILSIDVYID